MKKVISFIALLLYLLTANAESTKTIRLSFAKHQFSFIENAFGTKIIPNSIMATYSTDANKPGLPLISVNIGLPKGVIFKNVRETVSEELILNNIVIATNPRAIPTNFNGQLSSPKKPTYNESTYPNENVQYIGTSEIGNYTMVRFLICPFKYDVQNKKLYITSNITLNLTLNDSPMMASIEDESQTDTMKELFKSQIINPEDFADEGIATLGLDIGGELITAKPKIEYIIVTSHTLAPYFKPLALWKKTKGVNSKIVTVEEISNLYPNMDVQLAIKTYLKNQYQNENLKYVLLGGDDFVVPAKGCYGEAGGREDDIPPSEWYIRDTAMPTDLYYSCFGGEFSWDSNGNGLFGDYSDIIDMTPSIYITRAPVRTPNDVEAFVNKILGYEKDPTKNGWNNNILTAGSYLSAWMPSQVPLLASPDSKSLGDTLYSKSIKPYWDGSREILYDINRAHPGWKDVGLTQERLSEHLSKGYTFVDMMTHGNITFWKFLGTESYTTKNALSQENPNYTIITTEACHTNSFDSYKDNGDEEICLSEGFIRNPNSGVVAYLGNSRVGWENDDSTRLGPSAIYEQQYYTYLFSDALKEKNFGKIVAAAKSSLINLCEQDSIFRWIQFQLNPVGDPEMPVYTTVPKEFSFTNITFGKNGNCIEISTGVDSCRICMMSTDDNGASIYQIANNVNHAEFNISKAFSICITKQNYIPYYATWPAIKSSSNKIVKCITTKQKRMINISTQLSADIKNAEIVISSSSGNKQQKYNLQKDSPSINADISKFNDGVLTVSLFANDQLMDSKSIIK